MSKIRKIIEWAFKKYLCSRDIHKVVRVPLEILPFPGFMFSCADKPRRFTMAPACRYCGKEWICGDLPSYENAPYEECTIMGREPFNIKSAITLDD